MLSDHWESVFKTCRDCWFSFSFSNIVCRLNTDIFSYKTLSVTDLQIWRLLKYRERNVNNFKITCSWTLTAKQAIISFMKTVRTLISNKQIYQHDNNTFTNCCYWHLHLKDIKLLKYSVIKNRRKKNNMRHNNRTDKMNVIFFSQRFTTLMSF